MPATPAEISIDVAGPRVPQRLLAIQVLTSRPEMGSEQLSVFPHELVMDLLGGRHLDPM